MTYSRSENEGFRHRLRQGLYRFRDKSRGPLNNTSIHLLHHTQADTSLATNPASISQCATLTDSSLPPNEASDAPRESTNTGNDDAQIQTGQITLHRKSLERNLTTDRSTLGDGTDNVIVSSDLWSAAYREAVESLGDEIDIAALEGKNVAQLFKELEELENGATHESAFLRGVKRLRDLEPALQKLKLALDLASPLANLEPTARTVVGVVSSVTAIAISFASADLDIAQQIAYMLEQISYIDKCDTLGQKANRNDIHKALVSVYKKILEFYKAACEILARKGARLITKLAFENARLPNIIQDFLRYAETLHRIVQTAIVEILDEISHMLCDNHIGVWLGWDKMSRQSEYHAYLHDLRADQACEFLLKNATFINWYHASGPQKLVILGDMGCGKTVSMAYLGDELRRRNECQLPQPKTCYYYCRDDETGNAVSIISGLILSLLRQLPGLKKPFVEWYRQAEYSGILNPATHLKYLEEFLQRMLEEIDRPIFFLIDGLDECEGTSRNDLLNLLKTLSQKFSGLKTILSSRPQEEILEELGEMARIELRFDAQRDGIIVEKAVERQLSYLLPDVKALVIDTLSRLAQGSAIWTKMTIELIKVRKIRAFHPMQRFLEEILLPPQLSELYATLLSRCASNDPENHQLASTALTLLAISRRPLSILELAWAVTLAAQHVTTVDALAKLVDHQRVMSLIHPFIAHVDFRDVKKRQIRLRHQSVKEFTMERWTSKRAHLQGSALTETDQVFLDQHSDSPEAFILEICIRYLLLDEIGNRDLFSEEQVAIAELPQEFDLFSDNEEPVEYDPYCTWESWEEDMIRFDPTDRGFGEFFVYASCHWLEHFGAIAVEPLPSLASIEKLCQAGSTRLQNWIQQNCRPGCAITPRFQFDSSLYDPLSITSLYGSVAMLRDMLKNSDFDKDKFLPNPVMEAADQILQWGDVSRLRILFFDDQVGHQLQNLDFFRLLIKTWHHSTINRHNWDDAFALVDDVSDRLVQEQWGNELLCVAASAGCMPFTRRLITSAQHKEELRCELLRGSRIKQRWTLCDEPVHQSIGEAVLGNHVDVVEYLLKENNIEAHLRYRNFRGENVLHLASRLCNPEMFRLLAPRFPEGIHQTDDRGDTALLRIIMSFPASQNRYESARILLSQSGADWKGYSWDGQQNPLRAAMQLCDLDMCSLLIYIGNINPFSAMVRDCEIQMDLEDRSTGNENNMLNTLADLFDIKTSLSKGNSAQFVGSTMEEALRHLAEKRYHSRFGALASD